MMVVGIPADAEAEERAPVEIVFSARSGPEVNTLALGDHPDDNTYGYTTDQTDLDVWLSEDRGESVDVLVDMGKLTHKTNLPWAVDYIMEIKFELEGSFWYDNDGVFDPVPDHDNSQGVGDDPCPLEPFPLFDVYVNGAFIRTVEGFDTDPCTVGGPEFGRSFSIVRVGNDAGNWVRVPKGVIQQGGNSVTLVPYDHILPAYMAFHDHSRDGFRLKVDHVMIELAAPPLAVSHGWTQDWDPAPPDPAGTVYSQYQSNFKSVFGDQFGQDPWRWAHRDLGKNPILNNNYDAKQDFRTSSHLLAQRVAAHYQELGFTGRGWMYGHSMGGLVSRYYIESPVLQGSTMIEKLAQSGSPNFGSSWANKYTFVHWKPGFPWGSGYMARDRDFTAATIDLPGDFVAYDGWRAWWDPAIWAHQWPEPETGPLGRDHLADFDLKPKDENPVLQELNSYFPAPGVQYFTVRGIVACIPALPPICGDGIVSSESADMDGAIKNKRLFGKWHGALTDAIETARYHVRYFTGLTLEDANTGQDESEFYPSMVGEGLGATAAQTREHSSRVLRSAQLTAGPGGDTGWPVEETVSIDAVSYALLSVTTAEEAPALNVRVRRPDGQVLSGNSSGVVFETHADGGLRVLAYNLTSPAAGDWTLMVSPRDSSSSPLLPLELGGYVATGPELRVSADASRYLPGASALLRARVLDAGVNRTDVEVTATLSRTEASHTLFDDGAHGDGAAGDGIYGASIPLGNVEGALSLVVKATGPGFRREVDLSLLVAALTDLAIGNVTGAPADAWGGDLVTVSAIVTNVGEREARGRIDVDIYAGHPSKGVFLGTGSVNGPVAVGATVSIDAELISPIDRFVAYAVLRPQETETSLQNNLASAAMPFAATPRTAATLSGPQTAGWFKGTVSVELAPFDGSPPPYASTHWRLNDGPESTYDGPFQVAGSGRHVLSFWSVDAGGRVEPLRQVVVPIDMTGPVARVVSPMAGHVHVEAQSVAHPFGKTIVAGKHPVVIHAEDGLSGVAQVFVTLDGVVLGEATPIGGGNFSYLWDSFESTLGDHRVGYVARDRAGSASTGGIDVYVAPTRRVHTGPGMLDRLLP